MAHAGGRPTKYKPEYCQEIVEFCRGRHSLTGFAGHIGVSRDCLTKWGDEHPEFLLAMKKAKAAACLGHEEMFGELPPAISIFCLKNFASDEYKDKTEHEHSGGKNPVKIESVVLTGALAKGAETV